MSNLLSKLAKAGSVAHASVLSESAFFNDKDQTTTKLPILNVAFSANVHGGFTSGLSIFAGQSKSFKTMLALVCMKAYMDNNPDAVVLFYDSEFGSPPAYLEANGIDLSRVIHIPVQHVEEMKFDIVKRLEQIERGDKVFIMLDSLGALPSKKEVEDAEEGKAVADMTRAKAIRSMLRIVTPILTIKDIPMVLINHVYSEIGTMYPKDVLPGGQAVMLMADSVFIITKSQVKKKVKDKATGKVVDKLVGFTFAINVEKSRYVREKSKLAFDVEYETGIVRFSGMLELAMEAGFVASPSQGWYAAVDQATGEVGGKRRLDDIMKSKEFWEPILNSEKFQEFVKDKYKLNAVKMAEEEEGVELAEEEEDTVE